MKNIVSLLALLPKLLKFKHFEMSPVNNLSCTMRMFVVQNAMSVYKKKIEANILFFLQKNLKYHLLRILFNS